MKRIAKEYIGKIEKLKPLARVIKRAFVPLSAVFLILAGWISKDSIYEVIRDANTPLIVYSMLLWMTANLLSPISMRLLLRNSQININIFLSYDLHIKYLPAKYIPGGIWHTAARLASLHAMGHGRDRLISFVSMENVAAPGTALLLCGILSLNSLQQMASWATILLFTSSALLLILAPVISYTWILNTPITAIVKCYIAALAIAVLYWIAISASFYFYAIAFPGLITEVGYSEIAASYLFSWTVGFLAIFAPQGIGVTELALSLTLPGTINISAMIAVFALFRVVILFADLTLWLLWSAVVLTRKHF